MSEEANKLRTNEEENSKSVDENNSEGSVGNSQVVEDDFLNTLLHSAGEGGSSFSSWESGQQEQCYFLRRGVGQRGRRNSWTLR